MKHALLAALVATATPAAADQIMLPVPCAPQENVKAVIEGKYGEAPFAVGIAPNGWPVFWYGNLERGSWTVLLLRPDGAACVAMAGDGFEALAPDPPRSDDPT